MNIQNLREIINKCDPAGLISMGAPADEYDFQIKTLIDHAGSCQSVAELAHLIYREFELSFMELTHEEHEKYKQAAAELWILTHPGEDVKQREDCG